MFLTIAFLATTISSYFLVKEVKYNVEKVNTFQDQYAKYKDEIELQFGDKVPKPSETVSSKKTTKVIDTTPPRKEVYHVRNLYTYDEAKSVCKKYGGRLATYDEMANLTNGYIRANEYDTQWSPAPQGTSKPNWCSYGWTDNQIASYPIQQEYINMLPENAKYVCGKPGLNWNYISDTNIKFGANCYGVKPTINDLYNDYEKSKQDLAKKELESVQKSIIAAASKVASSSEAAALPKDGVVLPHFDLPYKTLSIYSLYNQSNNTAQSQ